MPYFDGSLLSHFVKYGEMKNLLASMNVDLKDYLILGASLRNILPSITIFKDIFHVERGAKYVPIKLDCFNEISLLLLST